MTKILFTGITGLLGKYFLSEKLSDYEIIGTYKSNSSLNLKNSIQLDVSDKSEVQNVIYRVNPSVIVHAASIGSVDYCESHQDEALAVNVEGTKNIISSCEEKNIKIIFISSNAVFDGDNPPYSEISKINPLDVYGKTKAHGEKEVKNSVTNWVIIRLMTMYGWNNPNERTNPVTWALDQLKSKNSIKVVDDIYNNHLYAGQAAEVLWKIIKKKKNREVYNVAGGECTSRFELAVKTAEVFGFNKKFIAPVRNDFFKNLAPRPKNTCFDTSKIEKDLDIKPLKIIDGLRKMFNEK